ncbi:MAG: VWA domain-containing protein [Bryobacterales bacterium]|nr:VWA domain-containing protein [Bryobacterales bacterium]
MKIVPRGGQDSLAEADSARAKTRGYDRNMRFRGPLCLLVSAFLGAQDTPRPAIRTSVPLVLVPASVTDSAGKPLNGLEESDFLLYEGNKVRAHRLETVTQPVAVLFAVQANRRADPALRKLPAISSMVLPLIAGEGGKAAVLSFGDRIEMLQDFSRDAGEIAAAFRALRGSGEGARTIDAVDEGIARLERLDRRYRKVIVLIGETRDRSSEMQLEEVLRNAAKSNVTVYPVSFSVYLTAFTTKPSEYQNGTSLNIIAGIQELARLGKPKAADALAAATGGLALSFARLRRLEEILLRVGDDLHQQYLLTFTPGDGPEGYRDLRVEVRGRTGVTVRFRPGYWASIQ